MRSSVVATAVAAVATAAAVWWLTVGRGSDVPPAPPSQREPGRRKARRGKSPSVITVCADVLVPVAHESDEAKGDDGVWQPTWQQGAAQWVADLSRDFVIVVVVERCDSDERQAAFTAALESAGVPRDRCVFCEQSDSVIHIVRHITPLVCAACYPTLHAAPHCHNLLQTTC